MGCAMTSSPGKEACTSWGVAPEWYERRRMVPATKTAPSIDETVPSDGIDITVSKSDGPRKWAIVATSRATWPEAPS